jgi:hypothetical protein
MGSTVNVIWNLCLLALAVSGCAAEKKAVNPGPPHEPPPVHVPLTIHVPADALTIQAGLDSAQTGDTVLVAPGQYSGDGNRDLEFRGKDIVLLGQGGADSCVIVCGGPLEHHRGLVFRHGETRRATLDGFTITGGNPGGGPNGAPGGAVACSLASPTIRRCRFADNMGNPGGGAYLHGTEALIEQCEFLRNNAPGYLGSAEGGGLASVFGNPVIRDCVFRNNSSDGSAGGLSVAYTTKTGSGILERLLVEGNEAVGNAGGMGLASFTGTVSDCDIVGNDSEEGEGGGVWIGFCAAVLRNCRIENNLSNSGGAVQVTGGATQLIEVSIRGNGAYGYDGDGGGLWSAYGSVICRGCLITDNSGYEGGGIHCDHSGTVDAERCTIAGNRSWGGGIYIWGTWIRLVQCVVARNHSVTGFQVYGSGGEVKIADCLIDTARVGGAGGTAVTKAGLLIADDPRFCAPRSGAGGAEKSARSPSTPATFGDYRLAKDSPGRRPGGTVWGALTDTCGAPQ